jgi:hypothetical protein
MQSKVMQTTFTRFYTDEAIKGPFLSKKAIALGGLVLLALLALALAFAVPAGAAPNSTLSLTVNNTADVPDAHPGDGKCETATGNGICTLRAAIMETNAWAGADTINLKASTEYVLSRPGIDTVALNGDLDITDDLRINGAGATVNGGGIDRVFDIRLHKPSHRVTLTALTIRNGHSKGGGGIYNSGILYLESVAVTRNHGTEGGGIFNRGYLVIENSNINGNTADYNGGGIENDGTQHGSLKIRLSTVNDNTTAGWGGGIYNNGGKAEIDTSAVFNNHGGWAGGGIFSGFVGADLLVTNSTISGNKAGTLNGPTASGGGLANWGDADKGSGVATFVNSTIANNTATGPGGGIMNEGGSTEHPATVNLYSVTVSANISSYNGGGVSNSEFQPDFVNLWNTVIANNRKHSGTGPLNDCEGTLNSQDYNLLRTTSGCTLTGLTAHNILNKPAWLGKLQGNGGLTNTAALLTNSPAINAGNPNGCLDQLGMQLARDQRGYARTAGGRCDIGAFEYPQ